MDIILVIIVGIFILALIILVLYIRKRCNDDFDANIFDGGVFIGMILAVLIVFETVSVIVIIHEPKPSAIDVYRGNTKLEITSVNGMPIDTVVVFKKD